MEAGLDNANNPFAISNGAATDNNILSQKSDGLLLNLTDNFKQNGTDASPTEEYYSKEKSNGKRTASEFDDDVVDFRPETDLDIVDDLSSPVETAKGFGDVFSNNNPNEGVYNPFMEHQEKAALEMERSLQKQDSGEFEDQRLAREETPTPPADAVHDAGGLEESNVAESDSEDEWNYFKGDEANKENISPHPEKEVAEIPEEEDVDDDNMSQLNPNAAEFVPVSPTRSIPSPACRALINDQVFAQSPKRPDIEIDINVPNPREFEKEVKSRPSEVDSYSNGHESDGDLNITPTDAMDSLLNGKNIDEIPEFQPGSTPNKVLPGEEFHFGPNAAPFTPAKLLDQSEAALSTKAVYGDESAATLGLSLNESIASQDTVSDINILNKESDPMSMSFYADKGESNPFDLDKVQVLPDNLDEFLKQPDNNTPFDDTISDLPEHDPLGKSERPTVINLNNDDAIQTTDLDKQFYDNEKELASPLDKQFYDDEKELASPLEPEKDISDEEDEGIEELDRSKTPEPTNENLLGEYFCRMPGKKNVDIELPVDVELISPEPREGESPDDVDLISPDPREGESPDDVELISPEPRKGELPDGVELISPEPRKGELPDDVELISPEPRKGELPDDVELISPEPRAESSQEGDSEVKSPVLVATEAADLLEIGPESLPPDVELVTPELSSPELKETEDEIARITRHESVEVSDMLGGQTASEAADLVGKESESKSVVPDIQDLICARSGSISPECELPELEAKSSLRELDAVCELPAQSPVCELSMSKSPGTEQEEHTAQEQLPEQEEPTLPICEMPASKSIEDICELPVSKSTETKTEGDKVVVCEWPDLKLTERQLEDVSELPVSSENTLMESEVCASEISKSPEAEPKDVSELPVAHTQVAGLEEFVTPVCRLPLLKSPEPEHEEIPLVCNFPESKSSVCDLPESKSPIPEPEVCNLPLSPSTLRQDSCDFTKEELIKEAEERFEQIWKPSDSLQEDVISSSKDDASSFTPDHLIEDSFVADQSTLVSGVVHDMSAIQETTKTVDEESLNEQISEPEPSLITCLAADIENIVQDTVKVANQDQEILESCQTSSPKSVADTESVATTDVNSFLDRSLPPEVASPLSPTELQHMDERCDYEQENEPHPPPLELYNHHLGVCVYPLPPAHTQGEQFDLKTENILPEFAEQTTVTPSEDAPSAPPPEVENNTVEPANSGVTEVAIAGAVAAAAAIAAVATAPAVNTVGEKKKPTSASAKKLTASKSATTTKAPIPKPSPIAKTTNRLSTSPKTAPPKTGTAKPSPAAPKAAAAPKPLVKPRTVPIQKSAEKKPLANGDMKTTVRSTLTATKKISSETSIGRTPTTTSRPATATAKLSPTKTAAPKPTAAPRPATARHTTTRLTPTSNTATAKPRPTSLTTKTTTPGTSPAKTLSSTNKTTLTKVSPRTADAPLKSKPPTATAAPKARVPLTKTVSKAPDTEKQNKESANKITASRSTTNTTTATRTTGSATARTTSSTARRVEGKMTGTRTISKTTTTTMKSTTGKKPVEIVRNASSKTKTTKVEKPKENGVSTVVTEEITVVNNTSSIVDSEPQLIKDNSPMDNKLIMETTTLIQTSTAD